MATDVDMDEELLDELLEGYCHELDFQAMELERLGHAEWVARRAWGDGEEFLDGLLDDFRAELDFQAKLLQHVGHERWPNASAWGDGARGKLILFPSSGEPSVCPPAEPPIAPAGTELAELEEPTPLRSPQRSAPRRSRALSGQGERVVDRVLRSASMTIVLTLGTYAGAHGIVTHFATPQDEFSGNAPAWEDPDPAAAPSSASQRA